LGDNSLKPKPIIPINIADYIKIPDKLRDGNISFKVSFNDKDWSGICSPDIYKYNSFSNHKMFWCNYQAPQCQKFKDSDLNESSYPCYDSIANSTTRFTPGWNHGKDAPHICLEAKVGKIAIMTSMFPASLQDSRFIFSIFEIDRIDRIEQSGNDYAGTEYYIGNHATAIKLKKDQYLNYWDFALNKTNNPRFQKFWGSGLFRYTDDSTVRAILLTIIESSKYTITQRKNAEILMRKVDL